MILDKILYSNWNFMRLLRLGLGIFIGIQAIQNKDILAGFISAFFLFQAITNTGCCGVANCSIPEKKKSNNQDEIIEFEEVIKK